MNTAPLPFRIGEPDIECRYPNTSTAAPISSPNPEPGDVIAILCGACGHGRLCVDVHGLATCLCGHRLRLDELVLDADEELFVDQNGTVGYLVVDVTDED
ncbi:hypothetical protein AB0K09_03665 [Streptomyces sp. NPDC049577]|uniref:hypothetical protein n=1 Tax=Streptomyces sp. NPDC049577 TaxID=3155153 RepID=UPI00341E7C5D